MRRIYRSFTVFFLAIILSGVLSVPALSSQEGSCYLKALRTDVFVILRDLNRDGDVGATIWEGRINEGQAILVTAPNARFRLYYNDQPNVDQPLSGGNDRWCDGKRTVGVP